MLVREEQGIRRTKGEDIEDEADENEEHAPKVEAWALFDCAPVLDCCVVALSLPPLPRADRTTYGSAWFFYYGAETRRG